MDLASIYFGFFLAVFAFTQAKVVRQTRIIWRHRQTLFNAYLLMIWVEAWVNFVFAVTTYLFLNGVIHGRSVPSDGEVSWYAKLGYADIECVAWGFTWQAVYHSKNP